LTVKPVLGLSLGIIFAVSCATRQYTEGQFEEAITRPPPREYSIIEYQNPSGKIPQWLQFYLDADEKLVETLPDYANDYIFVVNEKGSGLAALEKWKEYFRIEQDFPHAVFLRMYNRLLTESAGRPDYYLGDFFEVFLKKIAGHVFDGASREDDCWIKVSVEREAAAVNDMMEDGAESAVVENTEEYRYYILVKINKTPFQQEIMTLFAAAYAEVTMEKPQDSAVSRLQSTLFSGF
jgi:hypothetical protein